MVGVIMVAKALPAKGGEVEALLLRLAEKVRLEPGNRRYEVCRFVTEPTTFLVYEEYVDKAAFDSHMASAHLAEAGRALPPLLSAPLEVKLYQDVPQ